MPVSLVTPSTSTPLKMAIANAFAVAMLVALSGVPATALADGPKRTNSAPAGTDQAVIAGQSFDGVTGAIRLNQTAGNGNAQANLIVITNGAGARVRLIQQTDATGTVNGRASILGFAGAVGAIQVNQSAGNGNAQGNVILLELGCGASELNDGTLGSMVSEPEQHTGGYAGPHGTNVAGVSPGAFSKASGIIQVDQVAGTGNSTANSFHLQIQLGTGDP
ncbi:MAG: hypothetical protein ACYDEK_07080 [Vulcanimicrobiaceae bacterium]